MVFWGKDKVLWLAVVGVSILTLLLARVGIAHFQREALLGREIDVLNFRWIGQTFWRAFKGKAKSVGEWYRLELGATLRKQVPTIIFTFLAGTAAALAGYLWISANVARLPGNGDLGAFSALLPIGVQSPASGFSFSTIWGHNVRAIALILLLGLLSFGVLGALMYVVNTAVIGVVLALIAYAGYSPLQVGLWGILPHGIFEIPALILSSAAVLHIGIALVTPRAQQTLGEVLIVSVADWMRIGLGLVLPLLTIAAVIETWVTPVLLSTFVK
jgi:uncharacterized membrane protein SpoIIM required for sporulation